METRKLFRKLANNFPKSIKSPYDHVGLMTGKLPKEIKSIVLCLDFDEIVYEQIEKMEEKPDLILTHHPFIFGSRAKTLKHNELKRILTEKIDALGIPVYSMHTNFDTGKGGMNDALAEALGLENIKPLETEPMARGGTLKEPMEIHDFALYANKCLGVNYSCLVHAGKDTISSVAIIGGGGSRYFMNSKLEGYDIYISGDVPHHARRDVIANHYNYLDMAHEIERIFMPTMKKILLNIDPTLKVEIIDHEELPELIA